MAAEAGSSASFQAIRFRAASASDAAVLAELRLDFMKIVKNGGLPDEEAWREGLRLYFQRAIQAGRLSAWVCLDGERVVGTMALRYDRPRRGRPGADRSGPRGLDGYVMSVYTAPSHRRRGIARSLLGLAVAEARRRGLGRLVLHPTEDGVALYEAFGFRRFRTVMVLDLGDRP